MPRRAGHLYINKPESFLPTAASPCLVIAYTFYCSMRLKKIVVWYLDNVRGETPVVPSLVQVLHFSVTLSMWESFALDAVAPLPPCLSLMWVCFLVQKRRASKPKGQALGQARACALSGSRCNGHFAHADTNLIRWQHGYWIFTIDQVKNWLHPATWSWKFMWTQDIPYQKNS